MYLLSYVFYLLFVILSIIFSFLSFVPINLHHVSENTLSDSLRTECNRFVCHEQQTALHSNE